MRLARKISATCALFLQRKGTIRCTVTASRCFSTDLPQGGLEVPCKHNDIPRSAEICALVLQITSCFIIDENLIFCDSPNRQIKVLVKFSRHTVFPDVHYVAFLHLCRPSTSTWLMEKQFVLPTLEIDRRYCVGVAANQFNRTPCKK